MNKCCEKCVYGSPRGLCPCKCHKPEEEGHSTDTTLEGVIEEAEKLWDYVIAPSKDKIFTGHATWIETVKKAYTLGQANGRKAEREEVIAKLIDRLRKLRPEKDIKPAYKAGYDAAAYVIENYLTREGE